jgi:hypothetical protein
MPKLNPQNERIKRDFTRHLKEARGRREATITLPEWMAIEKRLV